MQAAHAAIQFQHDYPTISKQWYAQSNYLCILEVCDYTELIAYISKADIKGLAVSAFREPDLGNQITAIAIQPSTKSKKLVRKLRLLFNSS